MDNETKNEIQMILELLKGCLTKNEVSIALKDDNIWFFDTDTYLKDKRFNGMSVNINELVNN